MEVFEAIKGRRSIRSYLDKKIEKEKIEKVLEAGRWAPSGSNKQPWNFIVVTKDKIREKLFHAANEQSFVKQAPTTIVVCNKKGSGLVNIGLAIQNICLEAYDLRLGTCIVGWFDKEDVREILEIPEEYEPAYLVTLGYPGEEATSSRKKLEEIVHYETW